MAVRHAGRDEPFERVVVASGRFHTPAIPPVPGLETFTGTLRAISTYHYRDGGAYRDKRVLVAGCAVSCLRGRALGGAAQLGADVVVTQRRQRYVSAPKFAAGVPSVIASSRGTACSRRDRAAAEIDRQLKEIVVEAAGSPAVRAPAPDPSLFTAGVTLSQQYLPSWRRVGSRCGRG